MQKLTIFLSLGLLFPVSSYANSYTDAMEQLGAENPEFLLHVDVEHDFDTIGKLMTQLYLEYLKTAEGAAPIPISMEILFNRIGFSSMRSVTMVSEKTGGGFLNQALTRFEGPPQGIFTFFGTTNEPFAILESAPADADLLMEITMDTPAILETIRNLATDLMGEVGKGMVDAQMSQPVTADGLTWMDIINRLNTRMQFAAKLPGQPVGDQTPAMVLLQAKAGLLIQNTGDLLAAVAPMLQGMGFTELAGSDPSAWQMTKPSPMGEVRLQVAAVNGQNDLLVSFSDGAGDWFLSGAGMPEDLASLMAEHPQIPSAGISFWYDNGRFSELQIRNMWADLQVDPKFDPMLAILQDFLMHYTGQQVAVGVMGDSSQQSIAIQPASYKTNLAAMAIAMPVAVGLGAAQAIKEANKAKEEASGEKSPDSPVE